MAGLGITNLCRFKRMPFCFYKTTMAVDALLVYLGIIKHTIKLIFKVISCFFSTITFVNRTTALAKFVAEFLSTFQAEIWNWAIFRPGLTLSLQVQKIQISKNRNPKNDATTNNDTPRKLNQQQTIKDCAIIIDPTAIDHHDIFFSSSST